MQTFHEHSNVREKKVRLAAEETIYCQETDTVLQIFNDLSSKISQCCQNEWELKTDLPEKKKTK